MSLTSWPNSVLSILVCALKIVIIFKRYFFFSDSIHDINKLSYISIQKIGRNFLWGTLPKQIELIDVSSNFGFDKQFCQVCSEGLIPKSTTTNFMLRGNFSYTDMFNIYDTNYKFNTNIFLEWYNIFIHVSVFII